MPGGGWLLAATATLTAMTFGSDPRVGAALIVFLAVALPPLLIRGAAIAWSAPALAPLLGIVGLAGAFPALAGTARSAWTRGAIAACGAWWLLLAEPLLGHNLLLGVPGLPERPRFDGAASVAASEVVSPLVTSGAIAAACCCGPPPPSSCRGSSAAARCPPTSSAPPRGRPALAAATASLGVAVTGAHAARTGCGSHRSGHPRRGLEMGPRHDRGT